MPWEMEELQSFIDKNLATGFIQPTKSGMGAPVFREKKDGSLRLCIDLMPSVWKMHTPFRC